MCSVRDYISERVFLNALHLGLLLFFVVRVPVRAAVAAAGSGRKLIPPYRRRFKIGFCSTVRPSELVRLEVFSRIIPEYTSGIDVEVAVKTSIFAALAYCLSLLLGALDRQRLARRARTSLSLFGRSPPLSCLHYIQCMPSGREACERASPSPDQMPSIDPNGL